MDICAFCRQTTVLKESHIIPAFVFRWLKETAGTGYIRSAQNPNKRVQDGLKLKFLCDVCERRFGGWETTFATKLFYPFVADNGYQVTCADWLAKFCTSVSWRVLAYLKHEGHLTDLSPARILAVDEALDTWHKFLMGILPHPGRFEQHLLPIPGISDATVPNMPVNSNRYFMRGVEMDFPMSDASGTAMTMAKMGPFMLFGFVCPPLTKWKNTRVSVQSMRFSPSAYSIPISMMAYFKERASKHFEAMSNVSERQLDIMSAAVMADPEKFRSSGQFEAMMRDHDMFGESALIVGRSKGSKRNLE